MNVLIVAHLSGGWAATEAVTPSLEYEARKIEGQSGGVIGIIYSCAYIPFNGEGTGEFFNARFADRPSKWNRRTQKRQARTETFLFSS